jgi:DNA-binding transcriptional regulator YbjK
VSERERLLLDAAIDVLADGGIRRLTHRAVDARAGVASGSTSNRFRSRDALLAGVLQRLLERETAVWTRLSVGMSTDSIDAFAAQLGRVVETLSGPERRLTLARHAVFGQAARESALRAEVRAARRQLAGWMGPLLTDLGSRNPGDDLRHLLALLEGLLSTQLVDPTANFTPGPAIAALLHGLIGDGAPVDEEDVAALVDPEAVDPS